MRQVKVKQGMEQVKVLNQGMAIEQVKVMKQGMEMEQFKVKQGMGILY